MSTRPAPFKVHNPTSLWRGPEEDGITFSLLARFLECRERFRLLVQEGLKEPLEWDHKIQYGSLFHEGLDAWQDGKDPSKAVHKYARQLKDEYPSDIEDIDKWVGICLVQLQEYIRYWNMHRDPFRKEILQEEPFRVPYQLPNGRTVILRGKYDSIYQVKQTSLYIQENKTKGYIDEERIAATLHGNFQTMLYQVALRASVYDKTIHNIPDPILLPPKSKVVGVCFNIIRRPLSEKHPIRPRKAENPQQFYKRIGTVIREKPQFYFLRKTIPITTKQLFHFQRTMLDPILTQVVTWWDLIQKHKDPFTIPNGLHFQTPWGMWNALANGFEGQYFNFLAKGQRTSLIEIDNLFPEL